jgi:peptide subunit release factor 1 (eRF1)
MESKIQQYIIQNKILPKDCLYHTNRTIKNKKNQPTGSIRVLATKDKIARVEYTCPECEHKAYTEQEWKRPFYVKCAKCNNKISVPKMKDQAKKELKNEPGEELDE